MSFWNRFFITEEVCSHSWVTVKDVVLPSAFEQIAKSGGTVKINNSQPIYFRKKHILIVKCSACGKIEEYINSNPNDHGDEEDDIYYDDE